MRKAGQRKTKRSRLADMVIRNALPTRWNREERGDAETKGIAILDGNVPPPPPPPPLSITLKKPGDSRNRPSLGACQAHHHISGPLWCYLATDRNTTPIVLKHRATNKRCGSETSTDLFSLRIDSANVDIKRGFGLDVLSHRLFCQLPS